MLLRIQTGKHQLRKNPLLLAKEVVIPECQTSALTRMTRSGVTVRLLQLKVNRINSVFNPVSPLTVLWQNWSSKHKDLENEKHFPEKKKKEEETKSYKQGEQRSYVSILSVSQCPGCQGNKSTPQARSIIPSWSERVKVTLWLKHVTRNMIQNSCLEKWKIKHSNAFTIQNIRVRWTHKNKKCHVPFNKWEHSGAERLKIWPLGTWQGGVIQDNSFQ